jgi:cobyrinic acid a,c-diamide synthase
MVLAGLSGGSGKTILSLGLARYWSKQGLRVRPFKKGPDYIDAAWLGRAAGLTASNLDPFLMSGRVLRGLFAEKLRDADIGLIEGNRGLFDGKDLEGSCSTSHLSRLLQAPLVLIIDATKMSRTVAAVVQGCNSFEPGLNLAGVVLNRTGGERHQSILRRSIEEYTDIPVLGAIPKLGRDPIPMRHMGLVSDREFEAESALETLSRTVGEHTDTARLHDIAAAVPELEAATEELWPDEPVQGTGVRIGVVRDASLWFYYPENLQALERAGAEVVEISLLDDDPWPELHGLYLGGGFPETQARALADNLATKTRVHRFVESGMPVYAECGGLMYLCSRLAFDGREFDMAGVFPVCTELSRKPQGHGYTLTRVVRPNPFHPVGSEFTGHEFHYSRCFLPRGTRSECCLSVVRGTGLGHGCDGLVYKNVVAAYVHMHSLSVPSWARNFVRAGALYREAMRTGQRECDAISAPS